MIAPQPFRSLNQFSFLFSRLLEKELNRFYAVILLRNFIVGMVAVFEPIYYMQYFKGNIFNTLILYAVMYFFIAAFCHLGGKISHKLGVKLCIIISLPVIMLYYLALWNINTSIAVIPFIIIASTFSVILFWIPINIYFGLIAEKRKLGSAMGKFIALHGLSLALGPLVGGFILTRYGWGMLFFVITLLLGATSGLLFFSIKLHAPYEQKLKSLLYEMKKREEWRKNFAVFASGIENIAKIAIWPLFLYYIGMQFDLMGVIAAGALMVGTFATLYIGKLTDRMPKEKLLAIGSGTLLFAWLMTIFVNTPLSAFLVNMFYGVAVAMATIPFMSIFYEKHTTSLGRDIISREIFLNLGRTVALLFFASAFFFGNGFYVAFMMSGIFALGLNLIHKRGVVSAPAFHEKPYPALNNAVLSNELVVANEDTKIKYSE